MTNTLFDIRSICIEPRRHGGLARDMHGRGLHASFCVMVLVYRLELRLAQYFGKVKYALRELEGVFMGASRAESIFKHITSLTLVRLLLLLKTFMLKSSADNISSSGCNGNEE